MSKKILIVDDDDLTLRLLTSRLEDEGYAVLAAETGSAALKQAIIERPDVVIMDIMLPDMQGSDVVKCFQESKDISDTMDVVFLSGIISNEDDLGQTVQVGNQLYPAVAKPIDFDRLLTLIS